MINLTITEKGGETNALSFDKDEVVIGRVQGNDIVLAKGNISKRHTKIESAQGRLTVTDMRSTNGTYVNGRKINEPTPVKGGDKIFVGDFLIVLEPGMGAAESPTSGARRMPGPPPPPPPPPRAGRRSGAHALSDDELGLGNDFGLPGDRGPATGGSRPGAGAPPPPPPRPTMAMPSLMDDVSDMGMDEAPPSLADVGAIGPDDSMGALAGDEAPATGAGADPGVEDVFGSSPAEDEDAPHAEAPVDDDVTGKPSSGRSRLAPEPAAETAADESDASLTPPPVAIPPAPRKPKRSEEAKEAAPPALTLETLLGDATVSAIVIAPGVPVEVERNGKMEPAELGDRNTVAEAVWQLATTATPPPPGDNPVVDVRLADGTHITALFPPVTSTPVCAVIRKPALPEASLGDVSGGADVEKILSVAVASRRNLLLAGDAQAVATLASALASSLPAERRIVSIGAGAKTHPGRNGWIDLTPIADPAPLIRAAVAFRPQHVVIPDLDGIELPELLLAIARGQEGVIAGVAARSAEEALLRLRAFSIGAVGEAAFPLLATTTLDLVVYVASTPQGVRVLEIAEPTLDGEAVVPTFVAKRPDKSHPTQTLDVAGVSMRLGAAIAVAGDGLPSHLIRQ